MKSSLMQVRRFVSYSNAKVVSVHSGIGAYEVVPNSTGVPSPMARHFAYTFVRDPLILFEEDLVEGAANGTQHCEVRNQCRGIVFDVIIAMFLLPTSYCIAGNFCEHKFFHQQTCQERILILHQERKLI